MSGRARFQDTPLLNVGLRSAFAGELERGRMATVRLQIQAVRKAWVTNETYQGLMATVKDRCLRETLPDPVRDSLETILDAFHDYADVDLARPSKQRSEQYDALELYCSDDGYNYLYKLMYKALRSEDADDELLLAATTLVELLTIDLYNLRMSQIGDPRYANFEGITHRGMIVPRSIIGQYEAILECPDLAQRNFGIPLGLMSSTTDKGITDTFSETFNNPDLVRMYWTIHVHGIDEALLQEYHALYPESVVTSICAMPVARVSPFSEKEILLRGAFFHLIAINKSCMKGEDVINLVVVMMNANRDHTTETSLDLAEKKTQRDMFSRIVSASKFQACSWISAAYNQHDSRAYQSLATQKLGELKEVLDRANLAFGQSRSRDYPSVWLGGTSTADFPRAYGKARLAFQDAVARGRWTQVEELMNLDYDWDKGRWFNMGWLSGSREEEDSVANSGVPDNDKSLTLLHRLVLGKPEDFGGQAVELEAWGRLLVEAQEPTAWKSLRSSGPDGLTASELALRVGRRDLALCLTARRPSGRQVTPKVLQDLQAQLECLIEDRAGPYIGPHGFRLPQLSVLPESRISQMWIPIPHMCGGFLIQLNGDVLAVNIYEIVPGQPRHEKTEILLAMRGGRRNTTFGTVSIST